MTVENLLEQLAKLAIASGHSREEYLGMITAKLATENSRMLTEAAKVFDNCFEQKSMTN